MFDRTGIVYTEEDADLYLHTWSLIGYYLGVRPDLLPLDPCPDVRPDADRPAPAVRPE